MTMDVEVAFRISHLNLACLAVSCLINRFTLNSATRVLMQIEMFPFDVRLRSSPRPRKKVLEDEEKRPSVRCIRSYNRQQKTSVEKEENTIGQSICSCKRRARLMMEPKNRMKTPPEMTKDKTRCKIRKTKLPTIIYAKNLKNALFKKKKILHNLHLM